MFRRKRGMNQATLDRLLFMARQWNIYKGYANESNSAEDIAARDLYWSRIVSFADAVVLMNSKSYKNAIEVIKEATDQIPDSEWNWN